MSGSMRTSADLDPRRRRALFRAWHRGIREMDLILGRFADVEIATMSESDLADFERLIEVPDPDLFGWIAKGGAPAAFDTPVFQRLRRFHAHETPLHS